MPRRNPGLLMLLLVLGGCMVGPTFTKPEAPVKAEWSAKSDPRMKAQGAVNELWWKAFNDPALDHLVDLAAKQNLPLQVAGLRIAEARAQLGISSGKEWPQVQEAFANFAAIGLSNHTPQLANLDRHFWVFQLGFDAVWELDVWGKYRSGIDADAASLLASIADYYSTQVSLTAEVARTYATIRTYEVLIAQAHQNADIQGQGLQIAQARFSNGATSELDVTQAQALFQSTQASIPQLEISLQQARNALSDLLAQPSGQLDDLLAGPPQIPRPPDEMVVSVPAEMLRRRPDIRGAELLAAAQCARIGVAKAELYPSFSLFGTIGFLTSNNAAATPAAPFSGNNLFYRAGPSINFPFFNYGRIENSVRVQDARFQEQLVGYRDTVLRASKEVEDAMVGMLKSRDAVVFQQSSVQAAQRSVEIALIQYREGAADYERVLDAQRSLLTQDNNLTQVRSAVATYYIALYKALGGGWEVQQGKPFIPESTQREMKKRTNWGDLLSTPRSQETKPPARIEPLQE